MKRRILTLALAVVVSIVSGYFVLRPDQKNNADSKQQSYNSNSMRSSSSQPDSNPEKQTFNKTQYSIEDPASLWIIVNKKRPLQPANYAPNDLTVPQVQLRSNITSDEKQVRSATASALRIMADAAKSEGVTLTLESGYRSFSFQSRLYDRYVQQQGKAIADTQSARPGHSEHQTGLAADLGGVSRPACNIEPCYAETPEGKWIAVNAYKYGFIVRYTENKTNITGYIYEPWHVRYVGAELAAKMRNSNIETMEEFFSLPPAPGYN